jgi:dTDP-3,4-didehydro-2,6-dideoxy-alpha-D-glucose 3-reductase
VAGIAVWGLGPHAFKNVLPAIEASSDFTLVGVCSRSREKRDDATRQWHGASWAEPGAMLADPRVEVVYLATPTGLHFSHGMQVLEAGRHLICEKSLTGDGEQSLGMVDYSAEHDLLLCEALAFQYHPRFLAVREAIAGSEFGEVFHVSCCFGLPRLEKPGFRMTEALGGGALLDVGCYPLAAVRALFGDAGSVIHAHIKAGTDVEVDVGGTARVEFDGTIAADLAWWYNGAYAADLTIYGERQSLYANRLFSKETVADSTIILRDLHGNGARRDLPSANAFVKMLDVVDVALTDKTCRDRLRGDVASQARLMSQIAQCAR